MNQFSDLELKWKIICQQSDCLNKILDSLSQRVSKKILSQHFGTNFSCKASDALNQVLQVVSLSLDRITEVLLLSGLGTLGNAINSCFKLLIKGTNQTVKLFVGFYQNEMKHRANSLAMQYQCLEHIGKKESQQQTKFQTYKPFSSLEKEIQEVLNNRPFLQSKTNSFAQTELLQISRRMQFLLQLVSDRKIDVDQAENQVQINRLRSSYQIMEEFQSSLIHDIHHEFRFMFMKHVVQNMGKLLSRRNVSYRASQITTYVQTQDPEVVLAQIQVRFEQLLKQYIKVSTQNKQTSQKMKAVNKEKMQLERLISSQSSDILSLQESLRLKNNQIDQLSQTKAKLSVLVQDQSKRHAHLKQKLQKQQAIRTKISKNSVQFKDTPNLAIKFINAKTQTCQVRVQSSGQTTNQISAIEHQPSFVQFNFHQSEQVKNVDMRENSIQLKPSKSEIGEGPFLEESRRLRSKNSRQSRKEYSKKSQTCIDNPKLILKKSGLRKSTNLIKNSLVDQHVSRNNSFIHSDHLLKDSNTLDHKEDDYSLIAKELFFSLKRLGSVKPLKRVNQLLSVIGQFFKNDQVLGKDISYSDVKQCLWRHKQKVASQHREEDKDRKGEKRQSAHKSTFLMQKYSNFYSTKQIDLKRMPYIQNSIQIKSLSHKLQKQDLAEIQLVNKFIQYVPVLKQTNPSRYFWVCDFLRKKGQQTEWVEQKQMQIYICKKLLLSLIKQHRECQNCSHLDNFLSKSGFKKYTNKKKRATQYQF